MIEIKELIHKTSLKIVKLHLTNCNKMFQTQLQNSQQ